MEDILCSSSTMSESQISAFIRNCHPSVSAAITVLGGRPHVMEKRGISLSAYCGVLLYMAPEGSNPNERGTPGTEPKWVLPTSDMERRGPMRVCRLEKEFVVRYSLSGVFGWLPRPQQYMRDQDSGLVGGPFDIINMY